MLIKQEGDKAVAQRFDEVEEQDEGHKLHYRGERGSHKV